MPVRLYGATSGYVDIAVPDVADNGTVTLSPSLMSPGLVLIKKQSFAGVASVSLDGVFTSTYKNYRVKINYSSSFATANEMLAMRLRASGVDAATGYATAVDTNYTDTTAATVFRLTSATSAYIGYTGSSTKNAADMEIIRPAVAEATVITGSSVSTNPSNFNGKTTIGGRHDTATAYDGFTLLQTAGTFTGDVYVYGYAETVGDYPQLIQPPGMVLVAASTFSAASSVSVDGCFSTDYDGYLARGAWSSSGAAEMAVRMRASGTDNSTSNYYFQNLNGDGTGANAQRYAATTYFRIGYSNTGVRAINELAFSDPFAASATTVLGRMLQGTTLPISYANAGSHQVSTSFDGFTLYPASGTITGEIYVYGYRKAL